VKRGRRVSWIAGQQNPRPQSMQERGTAWQKKQMGDRGRGVPEGASPSAAGSGGSELREAIPIPSRSLAGEGGRGRATRHRQRRRGREYGERERERERERGSVSCARLGWVLVAAPVSDGYCPCGLGSGFTGSPFCARPNPFKPGPCTKRP
jgi:hypothetical protein